MYSISIFSNTKKIKIKKRKQRDMFSRNKKQTITWCILGYVYLRWRLLWNTGKRNKNCFILYIYLNDNFYRNISPVGGIVLQERVGESDHYWIVDFDSTQLFNLLLICHCYFSTKLQMEAFYFVVVDMKDNFKYYEETVETTRRKNSNISPISICQPSLNPWSSSLSILN